jgi:hypothetical protein
VNLLAGGTAGNKSVASAGIVEKIENASTQGETLVNVAIIIGSTRPGVWERPLGGG